MNPEPIPHPVLMKTVALRAASTALRAGKDLASCASRPEAVRAGSTGAAVVKDEVATAAGFWLIELAGTVVACSRINPKTTAAVTRAVKASAPMPIPDAFPAVRD
jgi:hypothetical protein